MSEEINSSIPMTVPDAGDGERLDTFLASVQEAGDRSRSEWHRLIGEGRVLLRGTQGRAASRVHTGDLLSISLVPVESTQLVPEDLDFAVIFEDPTMLIVDKPAGLVVHPAPGHWTGTLVQGLLARFGDLREAGEEHRPGIVHRLDRDTSGLLVVGRTTAAIAHLQRQFQRRETRKHYLALVAGNLKEDEAEIDAPIARDPRHRQRMAVLATGRAALTRFTVLERFGDYTLLDVALLTGRTHQIRAHLAHIGHPIAADQVYGSGHAPPGLERQFLHASLLEVRSPHDNIQRTFESQVPTDLRLTLERLRRRGRR